MRLDGDMTGLAANRIVSPAWAPVVCSMLVGLLACGPTAPAPEQQQDTTGQAHPQLPRRRATAGAVLSAGYPHAELVIGDDTLHVEIADTDDSRTQGLMFRHSMAQDSGMLFVFDGALLRSFWMKNTWIPLSIAYVDSSGIIIDILEMSPENTTSSYMSSKPATYALEMNGGWFLSHGVRPGDSILGLPE